MEAIISLVETFVIAFRQMEHTKQTSMATLYSSQVISISLTYIQNLFWNRFIAFLNLGVSDSARVFHPLAISVSTNEDEIMFNFIGKWIWILCMSTPAKNNHSPKYRQENVCWSTYQISHLKNRCPMLHLPFLMDCQRYTLQWKMEDVIFIWWNV